MAALVHEVQGDSGEVDPLGLPLGLLRSRVQVVRRLLLRAVDDALTCDASFCWTALPAEPSR